MMTPQKVRKARPSQTGQRGMVLVVALLVMVMLALLGTTFLTISATQGTIASNEVNGLKAFNIAEAGLELAKETIKTSNVSSLNVYLAGTTPGPYPFGNTPGAGNSFAGGNYVVQVTNNNDGGGPTNDTDNTVFLTSTGTYRNAQRQIAALVQFPLIPTPDGSLGVMGPTGGGSMDFELTGGSAVAGGDWTAPANMSSCTTPSTCGTLTGNPAVAGLSTNYTGTPPPSSPNLTGNPAFSTTPAVSYTTWNNLATQLVPKATYSGAPSCPCTWGTPSAPQITVWNSPGGSGFTINGAGVLIINSSSELGLAGTVNWQGIVILRGPGELEIEGGTLRVFGATVVLPPAGSLPDVELQGSYSFAKYSSAALTMARNMLPVTVQSWREAHM